MKMQVKINDQTFDVEILDLQARPIMATVEGETFEVWPDESGQAAPVLTASAPAAPAQVSRPASAPTPVRAQASAPVDRSKAVLSPLPGTVVAIMVREGQDVKVGDELLTLEAMKMKNAIRANREGKISAIRVNVGDQVRHSQTLLEYAD